MTSPRVSAIESPLFMRLSLLGTLGLALLFRLPGIRWGLPLKYAHIDESVVIHYSLRIVGGAMNPEFYDYPGFFLYLLAGLIRLGALAHGWFFEGGLELLVEKYLAGDPTFFTLTARGLSVSFALFTVALLFDLGRRRGRWLAGVGAAVLLSVNALHIVSSHYGTIDVAACFFTLLAMDKISEFGVSQRVRDGAEAAFWVGLATATKYYPGILFVPLALLPFVGRHQRPFNLKFPVGPQNRDEGDPLFWTKKVRSMQGHRTNFLRNKKVRDPSSNSGSNWEFQVKMFVVVSVMALVGLFVGSPFTLLSAGEFLSRFNHLAPKIVGLPGHSIPFIQVVQNLWNNAGPFAVIVGGIGIGFSLKEGGAWRTLAVLWLTLFAFLGFWTHQPPHYSLALYPALFLFAVRAADEIPWKRPWPTVFLASLLLVISLPGAVRKVRYVQVPDTRLQAAEWVRKNIPPGSKILRFSHTPDFKHTDPFIVQVDFTDKRLAWIGEGLDNQKRGIDALREFDFLICSGTIPSTLGDFFDPLAHFSDPPRLDHHNPPITIYATAPRGSVKGALP